MSGDDGAYEAEFDASGRWLETEVEVVAAAGFPAAVRAAVQGVTGGSPVDKWEIEVTPQVAPWSATTDGPTVWPRPARRAGHRGPPWRRCRSTT